MVTESTFRLSVERLSIKYVVERSHCMAHPLLVIFCNSLEKIQILLVSDFSQFKFYLYLKYDAQNNQQNSGWEARIKKYLIGLGNGRTLLKA
jgi:hypothetical protein